MSMSGLPFDDFRALLRELPGPDTHALVAAKERNAQLTKPAGSLGRLEEIAMWLAAWSGRSPAVTRPLVAIFMRQSRCYPARRYALSDIRDPADGGKFRGRRCGDQPDLCRQ